MQTDINLPFISNDVTGALHFEMLITRSILENLVKSLVEKTKQPVLTAIGDASLKKTDLNEVILVGGMTRMPLVQKTITDLFGKEGSKNVNPDEAVAVGA
jgi:molecular chaperone DnaK